MISLKIFGVARGVPTYPFAQVARGSRASLAEGDVRIQKRDRPPQGTASPVEPLLCVPCLVLLCYIVELGLVGVHVKDCALFQSVLNLMPPPLQNESP